MAFTPEQEAALLVLIAQPPKIISDLESEVSLNGDEVIPVEDGTGTFVATVNDIADYTINQIGAATESTAGIAEIATQAETNAGSDNARIVTPLKLRYGFAASFTSNGYIAFPTWLGGLILQWGRSSSTIAAAGGTLNITFPTTFLVDVFYSSVQPVSFAVNDQSTAPTAVATTTSNLLITNFDFDSKITEIRWFSIGF